MNLFKNNRVNIYWSLSDNILKIVSGLISSIIVVRYLGPEQYGILSFYIAITSVLITISGFGMDSIILKEMILSKELKRELINSAYTIRTTIALFISVILMVFVWYVEIDIKELYILLILSLGMMTDSIYSLREYYASNKDFKTISISNIAANLSTMLLKVCMVILHYSLIWFAAAYIFNKFVFVKILKSHYNKNGQKITLAFKNLLIKKLITNSWPLLLATLVSTLYLAQDKIMIKYYLENQKVGIYAVGINTILLISLIPTVISNTLYPDLTKLYKKGNKNLWQNNFINVYKWYFYVSALIILLIYFTSNWLVNILYGQKFKASADILVIYSFTLIPFAFSTVSNKLMILMNKQNYIFIRNLNGLIINFCSNLILIPKYGIKGAAISTVISEYIVLISYSFRKDTRLICEMQIKSMYYPIKILLTWIKRL